MRFTVVVVLCACVWVAAGDVHLKTKAKLLGRLSGKIKHHKRGVFSSVPPYKYGHDIPHVTHSIVKPIVVSYPPTASVTAVKVPLQHPSIHRHPVHVGHRVPVSHPHYAFKFPHHTKLIPKPDQHFHHHHHHVSPRPVVPILPAHAVPAVPTVSTLTPIPQPSVTIAQPVPAPPPPISPIIPATPQFLLPQNHVHLKPILPAPVPIQPAPVAPLYPYAPQFSYALRPGNAVQTSYFATYPRYPLHYHQPLIPLAPSVSPAAPVFLQRPQEPHFHVAQPHVHVEQPTPAVAVEQTFIQPTQAIPQPTLHLQPQQPAVQVDHNGWAPIPHSHDLAHQQEHHFHQVAPTQETHFAGHDHFTQVQGQQVFEHHTGEEQYHEYQHQLQHHIQQQIDQAQYEHNVNQLGQGYGQPNVDYHQNQDLAQQEYAQRAHEYAQQAHEYAQAHEHAQQGHDLSQQDFNQFNHHGQDYSQHGQEFSQHGYDFSQHGQDFSQHGQDFSQHGQDFSQHGQDISQHGHDFSQHGHDLSQHGQDFSQPGQEYGAPHALEGRSEEGEEQRFHNHIPLGLQLPLDRPLDHFR